MGVRSPVTDPREVLSPSNYSLFPLPSCVHTLCVYTSYATKSYDNLGGQSNSTMARVRMPPVALTPYGASGAQEHLCMPFSRASVADQRLDDRHGDGAGVMLVEGVGGERAVHSAVATIRCLLGEADGHSVRVCGDTSGRVGDERKDGVLLGRLTDYKYVVP